MSTGLKVGLFATAAVAGLIGARTTLAQSSDQAGAQPAAAASSGLEEVVVTARRREEKAQTVPITLETFTPLQLQKQDIRDSLTLTDSIPGLNGATGASLGLTYTFLRGAPGVIFYWNQVPINANNQDQGFYFDIQNIQVLYGPQGTLFGLSNDAGALLFEPQHPKNDYEGYAQVTLGDYGRETVEGVLNVPVIPDKLLVRIGGQYQKQDGYQHVIQQNIDLLNQNYWDWRGSAVLSPTDNIQNEFMLNYFQTQYLPGAFTYRAFNPGVPAALPLPLQSILNFAQEGFINAYAKQALAGKDINLTQLAQQQQQIGPYNVEALAFVPSAVLRQLNIVDTASWDITDELTLKNIAGYQEIESYGKGDIGGLGFGLLNGVNPLPNQVPGPDVQYNEEIQLIGNFFDNKLNLQAGIFNQWGSAAQGGVSDTRAPHAIGYTCDFGGVSCSGATNTAISNTHAVYSQGTYNLSDYIDGLSFTGGFRFTWDKFYTSGNNYCVVGNFDGHPCIDAADPQGTLTGSSSQNARFRAPSYTLQLSYQWRPSTMFYLNNSLGYKTGGFNGQNFVGPFAIYQPEHLNNYEAGVKSDFDLGAIGLENVKARVNGSLYYGVYRDIEIQTTGAYLGLNGVKNLGTPYLDVGGGDLYGWDFQFTLIPFKDLTLTGDAEYNRGKYKNFQGPNAAGTGQMSVAGVEYEILPEYKFNGSFTYDFASFIDQAYGDVSLTGTYSWVQHSFNTDVADATFYDIIPGHHNIDMSLDWKDILGHTGISGRVFVTNLTQNSVVNGSLAAYYAIGEIGYQPAQPRMWGVTLRYEFNEGTTAPAPVAAYVPPPAVAPAPVAKSYMVFFDFNKSDLTPQAVQIVDTAAKNAGPAHVTQLTVTGHTDTVGSDAYNMRLSRRRAESVAAQLEKDGIASSEIEIVAKGKRDLLVPTADGVKEPQNRRVQIVYDNGMTS